MKFELANFNVEMLHHDPIIFTVEGVMTDSECEHFRKIVAKDMKRSMVTGPYGSFKDDRRTGHYCKVSHSHDQITKEVGNRISELVQVPLSHAESYQVVHYSESQEYQPHFDTFDPSECKDVDYLENGGQRIITALAYLSDVEQGGETNFPTIDKVITPKKGKILVFHDCYKGTDKRHPDSFHSGLPVIRGEKWVFNLWFRKDLRINKI